MAHDIRLLSIEVLRLAIDLQASGVPFGYVIYEAERRLSAPPQVWNNIWRMMRRPRRIDGQYEEDEKLHAMMECLKRLETDG